MWCDVAYLKKDDDVDVKLQNMALGRCLVSLVVLVGRQTTKKAKQVQIQMYILCALCRVVHMHFILPSCSTSLVHFTVCTPFLYFF